MRSFGTSLRVILIYSLLTIFMPLSAIAQNGNTDQAVEIDKKVRVSDFLNYLDGYAKHVNLVFNVTMALVGLGFALGGMLLFKNVKDVKDELRTEVTASKEKLEEASKALEKEKEKVREFFKNLNITADLLERNRHLAIDLGRCVTSSTVAKTAYSLIDAELNDLPTIKKILKPDADALLYDTITCAQRVKELCQVGGSRTPQDTDLLAFATAATHEAMANKRLGRFNAALKIVENELLPLEDRLKVLGVQYVAPLYYNAACYRCLLDNDDKNKVLDNLEKAIELKSSYKEKAPKEPDLNRVWRENRFIRMTTS